jgi:uncharacterized protein
MSSSPPKKKEEEEQAEQNQENEYLVLIPDYDHDHPATLSTRLSLRPAHLSSIRPYLASGKLLLGGATLSKHPAPDTGTEDREKLGDGGGGGVAAAHTTTAAAAAAAAAPPPDMTGSVMLVRARSEEEVRSFVADDVYARGGVWDLGRVRVWPFRTAVRAGVEVGGRVW